jgi:hypothetical protein
MSRRNTVVDPRVEAENNLRRARFVDNNSESSIDKFIALCTEHGFGYEEFKTSEEEVQLIIKNSAIYTASYYLRQARQSHYKLSDAMGYINKYSLTLEEVGTSELEIAALKKSYLILNILEKIKDVRTSNLLSLVDREVLYYNILGLCDENRLDIDNLGTSRNELIVVMQQFRLKDTLKYLKLIQSGITERRVLDSFKLLVSQLSYQPHTDLGLTEEELAYILEL